MKKFKFKKVVCGTEGQIFSVLYNNAENSEFEQFLLANKDEFGTEAGVIVDTLNRIAHELGPRIHYFKHEDGDSIYRLIIKQPKGTKFRLYCLLRGPQMVILGGCAIKRTRTWQEDPLIKEIIRDLRAIEKYLDENDEEVKKTGLPGITISIGR